MAGAGVDYVPRNGGGGPTQIINGQSYTMYSPSWYAAVDAEKMRQAQLAGQAQGTQTAAAMGPLNDILNKYSPGGSGPSGTSTTAVYDSFGPSGTGTGGGNPGAPGSPMARVGGLEPTDMTAANNASFATAKDKSGAVARSSLDSLRGELGATGMLGSGAEVQGTKDIISDAAGLQGQVVRDAAGKEADLRADAAKTKYAGDITQRGQDVAAQEAKARLAQEQRNADFQRQQAEAQNRLALLQLALTGLKQTQSSGGLY